MQVLLHEGELLTAAVDLVVLGFYSDQFSSSPLLKHFDKALGGALKSAVGDEDFSAKAKQKLVLNTLGKMRAKRILLLGLGKSEDAFAAQALVNFAGSAVRFGKDVNATQVLLVPPVSAQAWPERLALLVRGASLGDYSYERYKSKPKNKKSPQKIHIAVSKGVAKTAPHVVEQAQWVAAAVKMARDLVNESPFDLYPQTFAARAGEVARKAKLSCKVFEVAALKKMGMNLLLAVGAGSSRPPCLVHLSYTPSRPSKKKPLVLVGKGITFDSGGLSLKPSASMEDMKTDMAGAAAVLGAMQVVAHLKPDYAVHGLMALAENMPSGTAIRPGDIFKSAAGKTVEVNNTDAEGRLVLADALHYALGLKPQAIIDLATLTGAIMVALGSYTTGLFSNDDGLADAVLTASKTAGEHFWRLPLTPLLRDNLKSDVADMKNTGDRNGGAITAALFLKEYVEEVPWVHLDIAGPSTCKSDAGAESKGGSGVGIATLVEFLQRR